MNLWKAAGPMVVATLAALACDGRASPLIGVITDTTVIGGGQTAPSLATVLIVDNEYQPSLAIVRSGGIVVWVWATGVGEHNVTFDADTTQSSATQTQGSYSVTFSSVGTFDYHCTVHPTMTGSVVVR